MILTSGKPGFPHVWHLPDLSAPERSRRYGRGVVEMDATITAGAYTTVTFHFTVGTTPMPTGSAFRIAWRWPIDWRDLQTSDPAGDGYMTVSLHPQASGGERAGAASSAPPPAQEPTVQATHQQMGDLDPWMHCIDLTVTAGSLSAGDVIRLVCGERAHGGRGWGAPTCRLNGATFLLLANPEARDQWVRLTDPPSYKVAAGPPQRLVALAAATGMVNETVDLLVRGEDQWGNPTPLGATPLQLDPHDAPSTADASPFTIAGCATRSDPAVTRYTLRFAKAGDYRVRATLPDTDLQAVSNPLRIHATAPTHQLYWGDLHSGQTEIGCGANTLADHYEFARDVSGLQFVTHQANDHYITLPLWQETRKQALLFNEPEKFVVFLGCEWSPPTVDGGDRNVIYRDDETRLRRSGRFYTESDPDPEPDLSTTPEFHAAFANEPIMVNMHVGGRPTDLNHHLPAIEPLAEIHSTHGTSEWFVLDALARGYKVGITAGADGVTGRPGADHPGWRLCRNVRSGLTGVYASALTRAGLWEAFQARRCYATTGARIRLWTEVDGHLMGSAYTTGGQPLIKVAVQGTAAIERIDLLRGTTVVSSWQIAVPDAERTRILWSGTRVQGTARAQRVAWDGTLRCTDGTVSDVRSVGFQSAADHVEQLDTGTLQWRSATAGNAAGITLRLHGTDQSRFHVKSAPCTFDFALNQVCLAPLVIDAGDVNRRVTVGPAPSEDGPQTAEVSYRDTKPLAGEAAYWVRVVQVDQAMAWSSPVYVTRP